MAFLAWSLVLVPGSVTLKNGQKLEGLRVEDVAWALMWRMLDTIAEKGLRQFAAHLHPDCLEAAALLRVSRTLNDGRPARIFIRDGLGGVRELQVVNRSDPEVIRRVLGG